MARLCTSVVAPAALAAAVAIAVAGSVALAAPADYLGEAACATCHPREQKVWAASAHARASAPEVLGRRARDAACLTCHATGEGARVLPGVQCEACHGGGAAYAVAADLMRNPTLARALGLRDLSKDPGAMCKRCHRDDTSTRSTPFDYASAWKQIAH